MVRNLQRAQPFARHVPGRHIEVGVAPGKIDLHIDRQNFSSGLPGRFVFQREGDLFRMMGNDGPLLLNAMTTVPHFTVDFPCSLAIVNASSGSE
jgi:hypothetical protein